MDQFISISNRIFIGVGLSQSLIDLLRLSNVDLTKNPHFRHKYLDFHPNLESKSCEKSGYYGTTDPENLLHKHLKPKSKTI